MTVGFTGHRPQKLNYEWDLDGPMSNWIKSELVLILSAFKPSEGIVGMALGFDMLAAIVCLKEGIPLTCALPCRNQHLRWPQKSQLLYLQILSKATRIVYVHDGLYTNTCMQERNVWMADHSSRMVSCHNGSPGGTNNCIQYANSIGVPITNIDPRNFHH